MSIDAGTIYSSIRVRLDKLGSDISTAKSKFGQLTESIEKSNAAFDKLGKTGASLSLKVTAPIVAAGAACVKFASEANDSINAVNVVFKSSAKIITDWSETAATSAGMSADEFRKAATVLGSFLQNTGMAAEDSAQWTITLTQRAADMASVIGGDVTQALDAVKSALRGEADPIEKYGVSVNEVAIKAKAMALGLKTVNGELTASQKTQARLAIIMEQTARFQGDFANTSGEVNNKLKITTAQVKDMAAKIGQDLLPLASDLLSAFGKITESLSSLDPETRRTIIVFAGFAAATGPLIVGVTKSIQAVNALKIAMIALAGNPIGLAVMGVAAVTAGLVALGSANNAAMLKEVEKTFENVGVLAGVSAQKISDAEENLARLSRSDTDVSTLSDSIKMMAYDLGLTVDQVVAIGTASKKTTGEFVGQLTAVSKLVKLNSESKNLVTGTAEWVAKQKEIQKAIADAKKAADDAEAERLAKAKAATAAKALEEAKQIEDRKKAATEYANTVASVQAQVDAGLLTEKEGREAVNEAQKKELEALANIGYAQAAETTIGKQRYDELLESLKKYRDEQDAATFNYEALANAVEKVGDVDIEYRDSAIQGLERQIELSSLDVEKKTELLEKLKEIKDENKEIIATNYEVAKSAISAAQNILQAFSSLAASITSSTVSALEAERDAALESAGVADDTAVESAQKALDAAIEAGDEEVIKEKQNALKKAQIEEDYQKKISKAQYEGALISWGLQMALTTAQAAQAVISAYNAGMSIGPAGLIAGPAAAVIAAGVGALQIAAVSATKPNIASFATGGIADATPSGSVIRVAENGSGEVMFNTGETGQAFIEQMGSAIAGKTSRQLVVVVELSKRVLAEAVVGEINDGVVRLKL